MTKIYFARFARACLIFAYHCAGIIDVKWLVLLLSGRREHLKTNIVFFFYYYYYFNLQTTITNLIPK